MRRADAVRALVTLGLAVALAAPAACAVESDYTELADHACPEDSDLDYETFGAPFLAANCQPCHASDSADRNGAPEAFTFDTVEQVRDHRERMFVRAAADNTSMPPGPDDPPAEERDLLADWLACGAP